VGALLPSHVAANAESAAHRARAYQHLYSLDYDEARQEMEAAVEADPDDIGAERGLAVIAWVEITFRSGKLTVDEYLGKVTGRKVPPSPPPPELAARFQEHIARAEQRAAAAVAAHPKDAGAHYDLGATIGLKASYAATVEGSLLASFRAARRAFEEDERVLALDPTRVDAYVIVGTYRYVVASLSLPLRMLAYTVGFAGGKEHGIQMLERAAASPGDAQTEARVGLVLIYNREQQYAAALRVLSDLQQQYPRDRLLWLEAGATALRAGHPAQADTLLAEGFAKLNVDHRPRMFGEEALWRLKRGMARAAMAHRSEAVEDLRAASRVEARPWVHELAQTQLKVLTGP
jgi:tetratricopeptide (TPR) repeat protein